MPHFLEIGRTIAKTWRMAIFIFFKMAVVRYLGFVMRVFGPPTKSKYLVAVITTQNLVGIDAISLMSKINNQTYSEYKHSLTFRVRAMLP